MQYLSCGATSEKSCCQTVFLLDGEAGKTIAGKVALSDSGREFGIIVCESDFSVIDGVLRKLA